MDFTGWALFIDCDFVALADVKELFDQCDDKYSVMCAQHNYTPESGLKMDGKQQTIYPRKNWSSMMLVNCGHSSNKTLTKELVNDDRITGAYLHRFSWLDDSEIGKISHEWNWLVGWYKEPKDGTPKVLHYTEGGPWFDEYEDCEYNLEWFRVYKKYCTKTLNSHKQHVHQIQQSVGINNLQYTNNVKDLFKDITKYVVDPDGQYYGVDKKFVLEKMENTMGNKVAAIDTSEAGFKKKGHQYDAILESFARGSNGIISSWDKELPNNNPLLIRGVGGGSQKAYTYCWENNRTFYCVDTGYFGNDRKKLYHRVTKNNLQNLGPIIDRPGDRLKSVGWRPKRFVPGSKILICPPSQKVMDLFGQPDPETWTKNTLEELKKYTDRPIEVRLKPNRTERVTNKTIWQALEDDVYCLITYNSIAATEALLAGKPAIALGPNAAQVLCNNSLKEIERLNYPSREEVEAFARHLSYCQFTVNELQNGFAWNTVNEILDESN